MAPPSYELGRIYEDLGTVKAITASIKDSLEQGNREFASIREEFAGARADSAAVKLEIEKLKATHVFMTTAMTNLETSMQALEKRTDELTTLRHRIGGMLFLCTLIVGAVYEGWGVVSRFLSYVGQNGGFK